jgi:hypothetical protein
MLHNADKWEGSVVPDFGPKDIPNIRKLLTAKWLECDHNDVNWMRMLNIKKVWSATFPFLLLPLPSFMNKQLFFQSCSKLCDS